MTVGSRPVFVLGCPRSGTTLLQLMLHAHPRLAVPPENRYVLPAYYRRAEWGDLGDPENRRRLAAFVTGKGSRFRDFDLDARAVRRQIVAGPPTLGSALEIVMRCFAEANGAARWIDKRPMYVHHVDVLGRLFPGAQFVHLIRDGRAACGSLLRMPWYHGDWRRAVSTWRLAMEHARAARIELGADRWFELHYEQLVIDPEPQLRRLCRFLGEEFDAAMLAPHEVKHEVVPERKAHHANTAGPLLAERIESWRRELDPEQIAFMDACAGRELRAAGYRTDPPRRSWPAMRSVGAFEAYHRARAARHTARQALDARRAAREDLGSRFGRD